MQFKAKKYTLIGFYLLAIIIANALSSIFGASISIINAFIFIGLDLTTRDYLHEIWKGKGLWLKMLILIFTGSLLSFLINRSFLMVALASFVAFLVAGIIDFIVYHFLIKRKFMIKSNISNVFGAGADSVLFPMIAFGSFMPLITLGQFIAKVFGGFLWTLILKRFRNEDIYRK